MVPHGTVMYHGTVHLFQAIKWRLNHEKWRLYNEKFGFDLENWINGCSFSNYCGQSMVIQTPWLTLATPFLIRIEFLGLFLESLIPKPSRNGKIIFQHCTFCVSTESRWETLPGRVSRRIQGLRWVPKYRGAKSQSFVALADPISHSLRFLFI